MDESQRFADFSRVLASLKEWEAAKERIEAEIAIHGENAERLAQLTRILDHILRLERFLPPRILALVRENADYVLSPRESLEESPTHPDPPPAVAVQESPALVEWLRDGERRKYWDRTYALLALHAHVILDLQADGTLVQIRPEGPGLPPAVEIGVRVPNPKPKPELPPATAEADLPASQPMLTWAVANRKPPQAS